MRWWNQCPCPGVACDHNAQQWLQVFVTRGTINPTMSIEWHSGLSRQHFYFQSIPSNPGWCLAVSATTTTNTALNCRSDDKSHLHFLLPTSNEEQRFLLPTSYSKWQQPQVELKPKRRRSNWTYSSNLSPKQSMARSSLLYKPSIPWARNNIRILSTRPWLSLANTVGIRTLTQFTLIWIWIWFIFTFEIDM